MLDAIHQFGYVGIFLTIFSEVGLMLFPLPGDSLLFTVGILSNEEVFSFYNLLLVTFLASAIGGHLGYFVGTKIDRDTLLNNKYYKVKDIHLSKTEKFFEKYGVWAIFFSRFVPIVRSFISQLSGMLKYSKTKFFFANLGASIIWPATLMLFGKTLGQTFPKLISYAELLVVAALVFFFIPIINELYRSRKS